jgi:hypothetical protein
MAWYLILVIKHRDTSRFIGNSDYKVSNDWMTVNNDLKIMWNEVAVA